jgi:hypothetical protein
MGKQFPDIEADHRAFIEQQKLFFVATAAPKGRVNVSPKGMGTFKVLGPNDVAYLDSTGSGNETRAHLLASPDRRLTVMFCAFEGPPMILRLYGKGQSYLRGSPEYDALLPPFEELPGARQIVRLAVEMVQSSCGMAVPFFDYKEERTALRKYWIVNGLDKLRRYWSAKNMKSIDGLPTELTPETMVPTE